MTPMLMMTWIVEDVTQEVHQHKLCHTQKTKWVDTLAHIAVWNNNAVGS